MVTVVARSVEDYSPPPIHYLSYRKPIIFCMLQRMADHAAMCCILPTMLRFCLSRCTEN